MQPTNVEYTRRIETRAPSIEGVVSVNKRSSLLNARRTLPAAAAAVAAVAADADAVAMQCNVGKISYSWQYANNA